MISRALDSVRWRWSSFTYNFQWSNYTYLFSGNIAKFSLFVSILGYAIIFNDSVAQYLNFKQVTSPKVETLFLSTEDRIKFLYFGFVLLGVAEGTYLLFRPHAIKLGPDFWSYKQKVMSLSSLSYFIEANGRIRGSGYDSFTRGGKYYDSDYEHFVELCTGAVPGETIKEAYQSKKSANWDEAVKRYEPLLTGIMEEVYFIEGQKRKVILLICVILAFSGYLLLAIPSIELFLSVLSAVLLNAI